MTHPTADLGAYALGTLDPAERAAVATHLDHCPSCSAEVAELAGPVSALAMLDLADVAPPPPPEDLYARTLLAATTASPPRRRRWPVAVAAAVVVLAAVGVGLRAATVDHRPHAFTAASGPVHIAVRATAETAGTSLQVRVDGLPENEHCHLVAVAADGSQHLAGDWVATYDGDAQVTGATDVARADLRELVLYGTDGQRLVAVGL